MAFELPLGMWLGMALSVLATVCVAILAGRGKWSWRVFPLLFLEFLLLCAAMTFWLFLVWFSAKATISLGISASLALVVSTLIGVVLAVVSVLAVLRLVRTCYGFVGHKDQYNVDFGNSLWFGRTGTWRPREFKRTV